MIEAGQLAPNFEATTYEGKPLALESFRGAKLWLSFYRFASCPLCNYRIHEIMARYDEFSRAGIRMVGVMQSQPDDIAKYALKRKAPFPIISDPGHALYEQYDVKANVWAMFHPRVFGVAVKAMLGGIFPGKPDFPLAMVPADFLIDPDGVVWHAYYGRAVSDHIPFEKVMEFAEDDCLAIPA